METEKLAEAIAKDLVPLQGEDVVSIDPALVAMLIEILMSVLVDYCSKQANFTAIKEPTNLNRIWFQWRIVRPVMRDYPQVDLKVREVSNSIVRICGQQPDTVINQVYDEILKPDFSVI